MTRAVWKHELRGGYGYTERLQVEVVKRTAARVTIRVALKRGELVLRSVARASLAIEGEPPTSCDACPAARAVIPRGAAGVRYACAWPPEWGTPAGITPAGNVPAGCPLATQGRP